jgi:hypothetical protein
MSGKIQINDVYSGGQPGQYRASETHIGWKPLAAGAEPLVQEVGDVKRAEWLDGKLRILCENEDGQVVLALEGFAANDFDTLSRHFKQYCNVQLKNHAAPEKSHAAPVAEVTPSEKETISFKNVSSGGVPGQFVANWDMISWVSSADGERLVYAKDALKQAQWLEGKLRVQCETDEGLRVLGVDGFASKDYDTLWRHFSRAFGVFISKKAAFAVLKEENFDAALIDMEKSADLVDDAAKGSVMKKSREQNLLKIVENMRDGMDEAVKGDRQALSRVFAYNGCERIWKLRLVLDTVQIEVYSKDARWLHLRKMCSTIESVLKDLGTFRLWKANEGNANAKMIQRQLVWELKKQNGELPDDTPGPEFEEPVRTQNSKVSGLQNDLLKNLGGPLGGYGGPLGGGPLGGPTLPAPVAPVPDVVSSDEEPKAADPISRPTPTPVEEVQKYEDKETSNPLAERACIPGEENAMGLGLKGDARRAHYTRPDSVLEGWVWKRSRFLKTWRRRWLVLTRLGLESLKQRSGLKPTESMEKASVHRVYSADGEVSMARCMCVVSANRMFYMVCDDEAQKEEWMKQITEVLCKK